MNKKLLFSLLLAGTAFTGHADEARLLRFPATNGSDIVFSYAGDLYKAIDFPSGEKRANIS
jgi:tricorn protease